MIIIKAKQTNKQTKRKYYDLEQKCKRIPAHLARVFDNFFIHEDQKK